MKMFFDMMEPMNGSSDPVNDSSDPMNGSSDPVNGSSDPVNDIGVRVMIKYKTLKNF